MAMPELYRHSVDGQWVASHSGQEEILVPVTAPIAVNSPAAAVDVVNGVDESRFASISTHDVNTGILYVNAGTIGVEIQLPFRGMKATGNSTRAAGTRALDVFSERQAPEGTDQ